MNSLIESLRINEQIYESFSPICRNCCHFYSNCCNFNFSWIIHVASEFLADA